MRKTGVIKASPVGADKNIGDYMQTLAAMQFCGDDAALIERETLSDFKSSEPIDVIMNAWWIWNTKAFPPKEKNLNPLYVSIHILPSMLDKMLADGGLEHLKKHEPIGCRDTGTMEMLNERGIKAYFSGCMTLTLGNSFKQPDNVERSGIIIVDPYYKPFRFVNDGETIYFWGHLLKSCFWFLKNPVAIYKLSKKETFKGRIGLQSLYNATSFYHTYSSWFTKELLLSAEYVTQMVPANKSDEEYLQECKELLDRYGKASLIITTRIHCALPATGLETPVIFVKELNDKEMSSWNQPGRFGGLIDFFRVVDIKKDKLYPRDEELKQFSKYDGKTILKNKDNWRKYAAELTEKCKRFVGE